MKKRKQVYIELSGGCADVIELDEGVEVTIVDLDEMGPRVRRSWQGKDGEVRYDETD